MTTTTEKAIITLSFTHLLGRQGWQVKCSEHGEVRIPEPNYMKLGMDARLTKRTGVRRAARSAAELHGLEAHPDGYEVHG